MRPSGVRGVRGASALEADALAEGGLVGGEGCGRLVRRLCTKTSEFRSEGGRCALEGGLLEMWLEVDFVTWTSLR